MGTEVSKGRDERITPSLENRALRLYFPEDYSMIEALLKRFKELKRL